VDDARAIKPDAEVGEEIVTEQLGRTRSAIGAQTAKQVVLQRLREPSAMSSTTSSRAARAT